MNKMQPRKVKPLQFTNEVIYKYSQDSTIPIMHSSASSPSITSIADFDVFSTPSSYS